MDMTPEEILRQYNSARSKTKIITVLADLNGCKPKNIKMILANQGVTFDQPKKKAAPVRSDANILAILRDELRRLDAEAEEIPQQIEALQARLQQVQEKVHAVETAAEALTNLYGGEG